MLSKKSSLLVERYFVLFLNNIKLYNRTYMPCELEASSPVLLQKAQAQEERTIKITFIERV